MKAVSFHVIPGDDSFDHYVKKQQLFSHNNNRVKIWGDR